MLFLGGLKTTIQFFKLLEESDKPYSDLKELNACEQYVREKNGTMITLNTNTQANCNFYIKNGFIEFDKSTFIANGKTIDGWRYKKEIS